MDPVQSGREKFLFVENRDENPISACPSANDSPFRLTSEGFEAWLEVPTVGTYRVEVSSDLRSWESLVTLTNVSGRVRVLDPTAKDAPQRFYRAVRVP